MEAFHRYKLQLLCVDTIIGIILVNFDVNRSTTDHIICIHQTLE